VKNRTHTHGNDNNGRIQISIKNNFITHAFMTGIPLPYFKLTKDEKDDGAEALQICGELPACHQTSDCWEEPPEQRERTSHSSRKMKIEEETKHIHLVMMVLLEKSILWFRAFSSEVLLPMRKWTANHLQWGSSARVFEPPRTKGTEGRVGNGRWRSHTMRMQIMRQKRVHVIDDTAESVDDDDDVRMVKMETLRMMMKTMRLVSCGERAVEVLQ